MRGANMRKKTLTTVMAAGFLGALPMSAAASLLDDVNFTFTDTDQQEVFASPAGTGTVGETGNFSFLNESGVTWDSFQMVLDGSGQFGSYDCMQFESYNGPGTANLFDYSEADCSQDGSGAFRDDGLQITGLSIADGSSLDFDIDVFGGVFPEGMTSFRILAQPFGDDPPDDEPVPVPEPSIVLLLGAGLLALLGIRRRAIRH